MGCIENREEGLCEIYQKFPHPILVCGVDNHESIMIIDAEQGLEHLYDKCPLKESKE